MIPLRFFMGYMVLMSSLDVTAAAAASCSFPLHFQTNGTTPPRDWRTRIRDRHTRFQARIVVDGDQLRHLSTDATTFSRTCLESVEDDRFVVSHKEKGQRRVVYVCLQFVRRSDVVWQMRTGSPGDRPDAELCGGGTTTWQLDGWLVVDRNRVTQTSNHGLETDDRPRCALSGGFGVRFSETETKEYRSASDCQPYSNGGSAAAESNEVRIESRCLRGIDDLYVYFRRPECLPSDLQVNGTTGPSVQRFLCLTNWQEGQYSFVLLRHDRMPYLWLLRLPTRFLSLDDSFNAYIFADLFAATANKVADLSVGHLHMGVVREPPRPVTSICVDEHESCASVAKRDSSSCRTNSGTESGSGSGAGVGAFACARTCNVCNATRPFVCHFPADWIGVWVDSGDGRTVTFNQTAVTVGGESGDSFHCIEWRVGLVAPAAGGGGGGGAGTHLKASSEAMLVAAYRNGCRLRYLCIRVLKKSSSVLYVKFSRVLLWPLNVTSADMIDCRHFSFFPDSAPGSPSGQLVSKYFRLLYSDQPRQPVHCNLPVNLSNLSVELADGAKCIRAANVVESISGTSILTTFIGGCDSVDRVPKVYECILSFRALLSNDLTVFVRGTASTAKHHSPPPPFARRHPGYSNNGALYCWVFPEDRPDQFFLYEGSNCNESARRDAAEQNTPPRAMIAFSKTGNFDFDGGRTPPPSTGSRAVLRRYQPNSSSSSISLGNGTNDTRWKNTAKETIDIPLTSSNAFIVFMAVIVFTIFYIPFICSVSM